MIKNISFLGKAYFLDDVSKNISKSHKTRIENYAKKLDEDSDVIVIGQQEEFEYEYNGKKYPQSAIGVNLGKERFSYTLRDNGKIINVPSDEVKINATNPPIYNAYIVHAYDKASIMTIPEKKQFDFRPNAKSTLIEATGRIIKDIEY